MTSFHANIIGIYGEKGKAWLGDLEMQVATCSAQHGLRDLKECPNLSYNYVLSGFKGNSPIILKLGLDAKALKREAFTLKCFAGCGTIEVVGEDEGMLILQRAIPGISLKTYFPDREKESIELVSKLMNKLHQARIPKSHHLPHVKDWLLSLDKDWEIPLDYLQKARRLADKLLKTAGPEVLLHGDLHHDNILQNGKDWLVIDPKGVIGEPAYELGAFIRNPIPELLRIKNPHEVIQHRIQRFSQVLDIPVNRIHEWCFVQAVLAWVWALEDGGDTSYFEDLARIFDSY